MIGGNRNVRGALFDHAEYRRHDAPNSRDLPALRIARGWQRVVMPEKLVCAVNQVNVQGAAPEFTL
jgi:hypothetical protein